MTVRKMTEAELTTLKQFVSNLHSNLKLLTELVDKSDRGFFDKGLEYNDINIFESGRRSRSTLRNDVARALEAIGVSYTMNTRGEGIYMVDAYTIDSMPFKVELCNARRGGKVLTFDPI